MTECNPKHHNCNHEHCKQDHEQHEGSHDSPEHQDHNQIQEKYAEFQALQQQLEQFTQHLELLQQHLKEVSLSIQAVEDLEKTKPGSEILAPLANGIFIKAELKDNHKFIVNVGADVTVEKTGAEVIKLLQEQQNDLADKQAEAEQTILPLQNRILQIYEEIKPNLDE
ncbi:MAG: prefoldin subunit alpha [Nanoarchaeota archaeon]